jgi:hypothetical protein
MLNNSDTSAAENWNGPILDRESSFPKSTVLVGYSCRSGPPEGWVISHRVLASYGCDFLFSDDVSGLAVIRPGFSDAVAKLERGMVLVVPSLDHLCWRVDELASLLVLLGEKGVLLISIAERFSSRNFPNLVEFAKLLLSFQGSVTVARRFSNSRPLASKLSSVGIVRKAVSGVIDGSISALEASKIMGVSVSMVYQKVGETLELAGKPPLRSLRSVTSLPAWETVYSSFCEGSLSVSEAANTLGISASRFRYAVKAESS